jgi:hypothetical protein
VEMLFQLNISAKHDSEQSLQGLAWHITLLSNIQINPLDVLLLITDITICVRTVFIGKYDLLWAAQKKKDMQLKKDTTPLSLLSFPWSPVVIHLDEF